MDVRVPASEIKFIIDARVADEVRAWARANLEPDPHGAGPFGDEYDTTTLYLDTPEHDVFHRHGSYGRAKYRIRQYGGEVVFLERKLRRPPVLTKRRTRVTLEDLARLAQPPDGAWAGTWFEKRVAVRRLEPACQVSYRRMARGASTPAGSIRLTLDTALRAAPADRFDLAAAGATAMLSDRQILELKFRYDAPALFRQLADDLALTPCAVSKYRLAISPLVSA